MAIKADVNDINFQVEREGDQDNLNLARNTFIAEEMAIRNKG